MERLGVGREDRRRAHDLLLGAAPYVKPAEQITGSERLLVIDLPGDLFVDHELEVVLVVFRVGVEVEGELGDRATLGVRVEANLPRPRLHGDLVVVGDADRLDAQELVREPVDRAAAVCRPTRNVVVAQRWGRQTEGRLGACDRVEWHGAGPLVRAREQGGLRDGERGAACRVVGFHVGAGFFDVFLCRGRARRVARAAVAALTTLDRRHDHEHQRQRREAEHEARRKRALVLAHPESIRGRSCRLRRIVACGWPCFRSFLLRIECGTTVGCSSSSMRPKPSSTRCSPR